MSSSATTAGALAAAAARSPATPRAGLGVLPPALVLGGLFLYPLALIAASSVSGAAWSGMLASPQFVTALWRTLQIAVCATAGCLLLGLGLALPLAWVPFPGARLLARLIDTIIALPTFLIALAFTFLYGSSGLLNGALDAGGLPHLDFLYSVWGVILAEITVYTPFVLRPLLAAFEQIDRAQIEVAGSLGAGAWTIMRRILLPAALPALVAGGSLCLLLTVNEFGIVFFIGAKGVITLPLLIYDKAIQEFDYASACVAAVVNIALSLLLFTLYRAAVGRGAAGRAGLV